MKDKDKKVTEPRRRMDPDTRDPNMAILMGKCSQNGKTYGVCLKRQEKNFWLVEVAFKISDKSANREDGAMNKLEERFYLGNEYYCPYCEAKQMVVCNVCGKPSCAREGQRDFACPHCKNKGIIKGEVKSVRSKEDI
ncbi:MAG: hypothetical protein PHW03_09285 [Eubacteriales bacterium]|nr:hypothetical protein [Eubacteriales bacterium]